MLDQENNFYLISLNILITCLVDNVIDWITKGEGLYNVDHFWELNCQ